MEPTHAERARTIVASSDVGSLATIAADPAGYPFVSVARYALDATGTPILALSDLAEHATNVARDARASLMTTEATSKRDPMASGRVTLIGTCNALEDDRRAQARALYLQKHPDAFYVDFADFKIYSLTIEAVRYVGGFGRMSWVEASDYTQATADPLTYDVAGILEHMNGDHGEAVLLYARALLGEPDTETAFMTGIDTAGADIETPNGMLRLGFSKPVTTPDEARVELVRLAKLARERTSA